MFEWTSAITALARYSAVFTLHALIGFGLIVLAACLLYFIAKKLGWMQRGARGARWVSITLRVVVICTVIAAASTTAVQTGTIEALSRLVEHTSKDMALKATLVAGKPLGITDADQRISLSDAQQLAESLSPNWLDNAAAKTKSMTQSMTWVKALQSKWHGLPSILKDQVLAQLPATETTPKALINQAWRLGGAPALASARASAHTFAYGSGLIIVLLVAMLEWGWLWHTRRPEATTVNPSQQHIDVNQPTQD